MAFSDLINFDDLHLTSTDTLRDAKKFVEDLTAHPGFAIVVELTNRAMAAQINDLMSPSPNMEAVLQQEFKKGKYEGLRQAFAHIRPWLEQVKDAIEYRLAQPQDPDHER